MDFSEKSILEAMSDFKKKETGDGKRGPFYNGTQEFEFNKDDEDLFRNAVWQAYLDANRTMSGIKGTGENQEAFNNLSTKIQEYFQNDEAEFTHEDWCNSFIADLRDCYDYRARYGHAQKVVNMAFKYLYCCEGADRSRFEECHMPLDQYTLAWLFTEKGILYQGWSWFDMKTYYRIEGEIRAILKTDLLGKELVIWKEFKNKIIELKKICH